MSASGPPSCNFIGVCADACCTDRMGPHLVDAPSADFGLDSALALVSSAVYFLTSLSSAASSVLASGFTAASLFCLIRLTSARTATTLEMQLLLASLLLARDRSGVAPSELDLPAGTRDLGLMRLSGSRDRLLRLVAEPFSLMLLRPPLTASLSETPDAACSSADEESSDASAGRVAEACRAWMRTDRMRILETTKLASLRACMHASGNVWNIYMGLQVSQAPARLWPGSSPPAASFDPAMRSQSLCYPLRWPSPPVRVLSLHPPHGHCWPSISQTPAHRSPVNAFCWVYHGSENRS